MPSASKAERFVGPWVWLFPASYMLHISEEYWAPPTFYGWVSNSIGLNMTARAFLLGNAGFLILMVLATLRVYRELWPPWVIVGLATIVVINTLLHVVGTLASGTYSPGLVSAVAAWLPLGAYALRRASRTLDAGALKSGIAAGVIVHLLVPVVGVLISILAA